MTSTTLRLYPLSVSWAQLSLALLLVAVMVASCNDAGYL